MLTQEQQQKIIETLKPYKYRKFKAAANISEFSKKKADSISWSMGITSGSI
jgi:hypothetical protein